jgi:hypothetical protein
LPSQTTFIPENIFLGLDAPIALSIIGDLDYNSMISEIPENIFQGFPTLEEITIRNTQMNVVPKKLLKNLVSLKYVFFYQNELTSLPQNSILRFIIRHHPRRQIPPIDIFN